VELAGRCEGAKTQSIPSHVGPLCQTSAPPPPLHLNPLRSVGSNQLSGKIPAAWRALPLHSLNLDGNEGVCGGVPEGVGANAGGANTTGLNGSCPWEPDGGSVQGRAGVRLRPASQALEQHPLAYCSRSTRSRNDRLPMST
jgi:hypothetical protein